MGGVVNIVAAIEMRLELLSVMNQKQILPTANTLLAPQFLSVNKQNIIRT